MWYVIIVHIFESIFVFIEVQVVCFAICVNVLMIMGVVSSLSNTNNFILLLNPTQQPKL